MRNLAAQYDKAARLFNIAAGFRRAGDMDRAAQAEARACQIEGRLYRTARRATKREQV